MDISRVPVDYSGVFGREAMFAIGGCNPAETVDVEVVGGDGAVLGRKKFAGDSTYGFGVGDCVADMFVLEPYTGVSSQSVAAGGRCVAVRIKTDGTESPLRYMTAGRKVAVPKRILADYGGMRTIAMDEPEEISFVAPGCEVSVEIDMDYAGERVGCALMPSVMPDGMGCLQLCLAELLGTMGPVADTAVAGRAEVRCYADGEQFGQVAYRVVPPRNKGVRLCWLNGYGALDYYTFADTVKHGSQETVDGMAGGTAELVSYCEEPGTLGWLAGVVVSPRVWRIAGGEAVPVDVEAGKVEYGTVAGRRITVVMAPWSKGRLK